MLRPEPRQGSLLPELLLRESLLPELLLLESLLPELRLLKSELSELVVTDSIWSGEPDEKGGPIRRLSIAPLLAEAVRRISDEASVSSLFD